MIAFGTYDAGTAINEPYYTINLKKVNSSNNPLPGAEFRLTNKDTGEIIYTKRSDSNGLIAFTKLELANCTVEETKAPPNFALSPEIIDITKDDLKSGTFEDGLGVVFNMDPVVNLGSSSVTLRKVDALRNPLGGATFEIKGTDPNTKHISMTEVSAGSKASLTFNNLPLGSYEVTEIASVGKLIPDYTKTFTLTNSDINRVVDLCADDGPVVNDKASVSLRKIGILSEAHQALDDLRLDESFGIKMGGVTFNLYKGTSTTSSSPVQTGVTSDNAKDRGLLTFGDLDVDQVYTIEEVTGPATEGYTPRHLTYAFKVDRRGVLWLHVDSDDDGKVEDSEFVKYTKENIIIVTTPTHLVTTPSF